MMLSTDWLITNDLTLIFRSTHHFFVTPSLLMTDLALQMDLDTVPVYLLYSLQGNDGSPCKSGD